MRSYFVWTVGLAGLVAVTAQCGGATNTLGNGGSDASVDATKEGGGSSSSSGGGSSGSGTGSSTGSGSSSGSSSGSTSGGSSGSSGSTSGSTSGSSSGSSSGGSSGSGSGGFPDGGVCVCSNGLACCQGQCLDTQDDPYNCGGCGTHCTGKKSTCINGNCELPPCDTTGGTCASTTTCCGMDCCTDGQLCCVVEGPVAQQPQCVTPTAQQPTCPVGCSICP